MKRALIAVLILFTFGVATYYTNTSSSGEVIAAQVKGKKAPNFSLKDLNGKTVQLSDYKNKIVIVDFWATWCGPCRKGIPDLIALQKSYPKDVVILGITVDDELGEVAPFAKKYGINYPVLYADRKVIKDYGGIEGIPTSFVIDKKGNIVDKHVGLIPKSEYEKKIKALM